MAMAIMDICTLYGVQVHVHTIQVELLINLSTLLCMYSYKDDER